MVTVRVVVSGAMIDTSAGTAISVSKISDDFPMPDRSAALKIVSPSVRNGRGYGSVSNGATPVSPVTRVWVIVEVSGDTDVPSLVVNGPNAASMCHPAFLPVASVTPNVKVASNFCAVSVAVSGV